MASHTNAIRSVEVGDYAAATAHGGHVVLGRVDRMVDKTKVVLVADDGKEFEVHATQVGDMHDAWEIGIREVWTCGSACTCVAFDCSMRCSMYMCMRKL